MQTIAIGDGDALSDDDLSSEIHAGEVVAALVGRGEHILLSADVPRTTLNRLAVRLATLRSRVLRPSTADALTLPGLLAQVVGKVSQDTMELSDLEQGFELLTDTGPDCDRIVLLLDHADALEPAALRYLQSLARHAPLRLLLVGGPRLYGMLMQNEFGELRRGLVEYAAAVMIVPGASPVVSAAARPASLGRNQAQSGH